MTSTEAAVLHLPAMPYCTGAAQSADNPVSAKGAADCNRHDVGAAAYRDQANPSRTASGEPAAAPAAARRQVSAQPSAAQLRQGAGAYGCSHYRRRCKLVAPCCPEVFWCRHCHNQVMHDDEPVNCPSLLDPVPPAVTQCA